MPPKRKSAFSAALREAQQRGETVTPLDREAVSPENRETVSLSERETVPQLNRYTVRHENHETVSLSHSENVKLEDGETIEKQEKTSFYLSAALLEKLDDLAHDFRKQHGKRINRNDIVRHLVEQVTLVQLEGLKPLPKGVKQHA